MRLTAYILRLVVFLAATCVAAPAVAQGTIQQSGPVTSFHAPAWYSNGVVTDGGGPATPFLSAIGLFGGSSCPLGISSQTSPGASTSPLGQFSICQTLGTTTLSIQGLNGAATPAFQLNIGGTIYPFPGPGNGNVIGPGTVVAGDTACFPTTSGTVIADCGVAPTAFRIISSGTTDTATTGDGVIAWNSASASAKSQSLYACNSSRKGFPLYIKDEYGNAGTYPINVAPNGGDTIDKAALAYLAFNFQGMALRCDGASNWIVQ